MVEGPDYEDVTDELFNLVDNNLKDLEILTDPEIFDFEETMSSFEVMDTKMDPRKQKETVPNNELFKTIKAGKLEELS